MRTPCQSNPEMWVTDDREQRAEAMRICRTDCPTAAFKACALAVRNEKDPLGVWGGVDHHPTNRVVEEKVCEFCDQKYKRRINDSMVTWGKRKYCSRKCAGLVRTAAKEVLPEKPCACCGELFAKNPFYSAAQWERAKFCNLSCAAKYRYVTTGRVA